MKESVLSSVEATEKFGEKFSEIEKNSEIFEEKISDIEKKSEMFEEKSEELFEAVSKTCHKVIKSWRISIILVEA
jgi:chaperonin cofactor prefoldin